MSVIRGVGIPRPTVVGGDRVDPCRYRRTQERGVVTVANTLTGLLNDINDKIRQMEAVKDRVARSQAGRFPTQILGQADFEDLRDGAAATGAATALKEVRDQLQTILMATYMPMFDA